MAALAYSGEVRSPTFNLIQVYETAPPVLHADLYRLRDWRGIGIEDYLQSHATVIEWPDRAAGLFDPKECWRINLAFDGDGRTAEIYEPEADIG